MDLGFGQQHFGQPPQTQSFCTQRFNLSGSSPINILFEAGVRRLPQPNSISEKEIYKMTTTLAGILYDEPVQTAQPATPTEAKAKSSE